jgi:threonine dehydratase
MNAGPLTFDAVRDAAVRLKGVTVRTPLLHSPEIDARAGGPVLIKAEALQRMGSFKLRGAYNRLAQIPDGERARGAVAFSSGNHAQGVAYAAGLLGMPAVIVMPADAPQAKIAATTALGAEVVVYDRVHEDREAIAQAIAADRGAALVPSYDDPAIIAGQGTVGLEAMEQAADMGLTPDQIICCASGGGLLAGIALAARTLQPRIALIAAEPEGHDDLARSLQAGARVANPAGVRSACDALLAARPGALTFPILAEAGATGVAVDDDEVFGAMALAYRTLGLVLEPGGAAALAGVLAGTAETADRVTIVIASGGNVDPGMFARALLRFG